MQMLRKKYDNRSLQQTKQWNLLTTKSGRISILDTTRKQKFMKNNNKTDNDTPTRPKQDPQHLKQDDYWKQRRCIHFEDNQKKCCGI